MADYYDASGTGFEDWELENVFLDYLNDYPEVIIVGYVFSAGYALKELDPAAFREEFLSWLNSMITDGEYFDHDPTRGV